MDATPRYKKKLALLIAAHNEEVVLEKTIRSAIAAGMDATHIYVVDDNSTDSTSRIARSVLPPSNIMKVHRSGKGLAVTKAAKKFALTDRYQWIHIADADGAFAPNYFRIFRRELRVSNAASTGYIKSLPGKNVSQYRIFEYTIGMELHRRLQAMFNVIPIIPGPTSCFRSDVFAQLNFNTQALTEDFDVTLQLHRKKLGTIQYIPKAVAYTQDPRTVVDFNKQITRWNRGVLQSMIKHGIGKQRTALDAYLSFQILQNLLVFVNYCVWVPYYIATHQSNTANFLAVTFLFDVALTATLATLVAIKSKRYDLLSAFPFVYALRWVSLAIFLRSFVEIVVLKKYRVTSAHYWEVGSRRYSV